MVAENAAKEAHKLATTFNSGFVPNLCLQLPADAGPAMQDRLKAHLVVCTERKTEAQRENDLIYNAVLPSPEALPPIEKTMVATPIPIHDVYNNPDVQKTIGQDFFIKLIPLSVHESASVYSEEKAKLVRGEVEKAESADVEAKSSLESLGIKEGLRRFKAIAEGELTKEEELPISVRRWKEDIQLVEEREGVDGILRQLVKLKQVAQADLDNTQRDLDIESRDCEMMRVKYEQWSQPPSSSVTKSIRQDLKAHYQALEAAAQSDGQVHNLWNSVRGDIQILLSDQIEEIFRNVANGNAGSAAAAASVQQSLLDLDIGEGEGAEEEEVRERKKVKGFVEDIEERLDRIGKISKERGEVLRDLKDKVTRNDSIAEYMLTLNVDSNRRRIPHPLTKPAQLCCRTDTLCSRARKVQALPAAPRSHCAPPRNDITRNNYAVEAIAGLDFRERRWKGRQLGKEVGRQGEEEEGDGQAVREREGQVYGG